MQIPAHNGNGCKIAYKTDKGVENTAANAVSDEA